MAQVSELSEMKQRSKNYGRLLRIRMLYPRIYFAGYIEVVTKRPQTLAVKLIIRNSTEHFSRLFVNISHSSEVDA